MSYKIVRHFRDSDRRYTLQRGLALHEAQAHCRMADASSATARSKAAKARTRKLGSWFDGYEEEPVRRSRFRNGRMTAAQKKHYLPR